MTQQESELQQEIAVMQKLMIEQATQQSKDSDDSADEGENDAVSEVTQ